MSTIDNFLPKGLPSMVDKEKIRPNSPNMKRGPKGSSKKSAAPKAAGEAEVKDRVVLSKPSKFSKAEIQKKLDDKNKAPGEDAGG